VAYILKQRNIKIMGIFERLGTIISSYLNDFGGETGERLRSSGERFRSSDPDFDAAYEELNDFLKGGAKAQPSRKSAGNNQSGDYAKTSNVKLPPESLRADFEYLGVPFGADNETCKTAYKNLLKIHHPDRHAGHEGNYKKATERSAKINAAYDRIEKWRQEK
jgi:DnaJ-domain-containing protein 1